MFTANPFRVVTRLLGDKRSGTLKKSKEEVEEYLRQTHSDPQKGVALGDNDMLPNPPPPASEFNYAQPTMSEMTEILKKARAGSAPGPNGVPYKVYKYCPKLARRLWHLIKVIWRRGHVPDCWTVSEGIFAPKEQNSIEISQFRTISLLNVEGKIFISLLSRRLTSFLLENNYIDTSVQKGGIPGVAGCVEHTSVITQIIREAKEKKGELAVIWLDLANAYGTLPHQLIDITLQKYHVPEKVRKLLAHYYNNFKLRFTVEEFTTAWQFLEIGLVTGCTISEIIFAAAANLLVKAAEKKSRGPVLASGSKQPPTRVFMDNMIITAKNVVEGRWMLEDLEKLFTWTRIRFKPTQSRGLVIR